MSQKMLSWSVGLVVVASWVSWSSSPAYAVNYNVINLGALSASPSAIAEAEAINSYGQVVGTSSSDISFQRAFLWTPGGTGGVSHNPQMKDLGTLGGMFAQAFGINDHGQVIGISETTNENEFHAFLWTPGGTDGVSGNPQMKDLGIFDGGQSWAYDINNINGDPSQSQVSGSSQDYITRAFLWTPGATDGSPTNPQMKDLGTLGHVVSQGRGVNDVGQVAINSFSSINSGQALLWTPGGTDGDPNNPELKNLGTLGGAWAGSGDINNSGLVVGQSEIPGGQRRAFLWTSGGTDGVPGNLQMKDLGATGGTSSLAWAINDLGHVVGEIGNVSGSLHAYIWTAGSGMIDLHSQISAALGWGHSTAKDINNSGWITGWGGNNPSVPQTAILMTPILDCYLGDADGDGDVDFNDFLAVQNNSGDPGPNSPGDVDCDGDCDFDDFLAVQNFFGTIYVPQGYSPGLSN